MTNAQAELERILLTVSDGIVVVDEHGIVLYANPSAERILERTGLLGQNLAIPLAPGATQQEIGLIHPHGIGWAELRTSSLIWEGNSAFLIAIRDISAQKQLETTLVQREAYQRKILLAIPSNVVIVNAAGVIEYINHPSSGLEENKVIGSNLLDWIDGQDQARVAATFEQVLATGTAAEAEYRAVGSGTSMVWFHVKFARLSEHEPKIILVATEITEHKLAELKIQQSERALKKAQTLAHIGSWTWHPKTNSLEWSDEMFIIFGIEQATFSGNLAEVIDRAIHPDDRARVERSNRSVIHNARPIPLEYRIVWPNGTVRTVWAEAGESVFDERGEITALSGIVQDITERVQQEESLRIAATAFESQEGMLVTDASGTILRVNHAFTLITGYAPEEVIGKNPNLLRSGRQEEAFYAEMWDRLRRSGEWEGEIWNKRKNGDIYPEHLTITAVKNSEGVVSNYVGTLTDITMSKAASEEIHRLAFYDTLTNLPNRRLLQDRLTQAFATSARSGKSGAMLFIDLDNFKKLNDTLGHDMGDLLLQQIAARLTACVREGDTVCRFGGDEFLVMLVDLSQLVPAAAALAESVGNKILTALSQPYLLDGQQYNSTCSIGAVLFNDHKVSMDELLKQADISMYQAKTAGRNTLRFFDPEMQASVTAKVSLENDLRTALDQQQFQLHYQAQVDSDGVVCGAEALIRWQHPQRGLISPAEFIPLAEESGLILPIGAWVLDTACAQLAAWQPNPLTKNLSLAVNVSAKQFHQADFVEQMRQRIRQYAFEPKWLKLEITESLLMGNSEEIITKIDELKLLGFRFSLDDFGTGYSSLQYLKQLPIDQLKIDQSFVRDIYEDKNDQAIVRTIIAMAHTLNMSVIAEGVETEAQRLLLLGQGCTHHQGYLFGKPMPQDQFLNSLVVAGD